MRVSTNISLCRLHKRLTLHVSKLVVSKLFPSEVTSADIWIGHRSMYFLVLVPSFLGVSSDSKPHPTAMLSLYRNARSSSIVRYSFGDIIFSVRITSVGRMPSMSLAD